MIPVWHKRYQPNPAASVWQDAFLLQVIPDKGNYHDLTYVLAIPRRSKDIDPGMEIVLEKQRSNVRVKRTEVPLA